MPDVTSGCSFDRFMPGKILKITTAATADDGDTIAVTLADYGMAAIDGITTMTHTTTDSIIIDSEKATTAVVAGVLTITIGGATDNEKRVIYVYGRSTA
jgi:hypothetical protein